ncbi:MAG: hypothetical protein K2P87_11040 [Lachnospiraceae bacterium]|nr:hypothetical protein [Lachnospiraceae bacterium]
MSVKKAILIYAAVMFCAACGKGGGEGRIADSDRSGYMAVDYADVSVEGGIESFMISGEGRILCSGADEKLYTCSGAGEDQKEIPAASFYGNLCAADGVVYAYDYKKSAIVRLGGDGGLPEGQTEEISNSLSFHTIRNMVALDDKIYVLAIPATQENAETFYSFGIQRFEDYGEQVYCIDIKSGESRILGLEHITAQYRSEHGRLFFYGWKEEKYWLYEYDVEKGKVTGKLSFDSFGNFLNMVVEGGYLFGFDPSEGLVGIDLADGEKTVWTSDVYAMFGNDLQFYRGNLFVNDAAAKKIRQVLVIGREGDVTERLGHTGTVCVDGADGRTPGNEESDDAVSAENTPQPTEWPKRTETVAVASNSLLEISTKEIKRISGMKTKETTMPLDLEAVITELMAGNPDVDIYVFPHSWAVTQRIKELGLYVPLNGSEIISGHIGKCFDYIRDAATNDNGELWMLPLYEYSSATWYIPENMEKFGITTEELGTVDAYLAVLKRLHGQTGIYRYYNQAFTFWDHCDLLYDLNYNDYTAGMVDFDTERYRSLVELLLTGWDRYSGPEANHPWFFNVAQQGSGEHRVGKTPDFYQASVIFKTDSVNAHLYKELFSAPEQYNVFLEGWRALPFPRLGAEGEKGLVSLEYAYVNPYGRQQEAAVAYLEVIAANQNRISKLPLFFREDVEYYEELYDTSLPVFRDLYGIHRDAQVICGYSWDLSDSYVTDYQGGLISLDELVERRQKRAVTGLYE